MESSGSDLMIFFSTLPDVRCDVPFSERMEDKDSVIGVELRLANTPLARQIPCKTIPALAQRNELTSQPTRGRCGATLGIRNVLFW